MKTPQVIMVGNRQYTVNPFEQYVLQFLAAIYTQRNGEAVLQNTLDSLAPMLEVVVEEVCPEIQEKIGFNRASGIYFWKRDLTELAEMVGGLMACHFRWQIQEFQDKGLGDSEDCLSTVRQLNETVRQLQILRESAIAPMPPVVVQNSSAQSGETLEELKAKIAALEAANP